MTLTALGWNDSLALAFAPYAAEGCQPARVTLELKGYFEVSGDFGAKLGACSGKFVDSTRAPADYPAIGDWVAITPQAGDDTRAYIHAVLPRRTKFSRLAAGHEEVEQIVAANIDTLFLVSALDGNHHLHRLERYLAAAWAGGAQPVVLLNKADIADDADAIIADIAIVAPNVPVFVVSGQTRRGLKALAPYLQPGQTLALLGSSGVGKSTLINRIVGEARQTIQEVRDVDGKGRHTTTQRELLIAPNGVIVIDTPGMREIQPWAAGASIDQVFQDVIALASRCRFRDCAHGSEPGCAIQAALADNSLNSVRWQSYLRLGRATIHTARAVDRTTQPQHKSHHKKITKKLRQRIDEKTTEE